MRISFRLVTPKDYLDFLEKRKWWIVIPILLIGPAASLLIHSLPDIFVSSCLILIEPQKIDPNFVRNPVSVGIKDRLNQIRNRILSSSNLGVIVTKFKLFEDHMISLSEQGKVEVLKNKIQIYVDTPSGSNDRQVSYFSISYEDRDPALAQRVTAEIASQFLSEEEKQSKEKIVKTSNFIDTQIAERMSVLEAKKRELSQVRLQNMVNMPFDAATYAKQLESLDEEVRSVREGVDRWQDKLLSLERDLSTTPQTIQREVQAYDEEVSDTTPTGEPSPPSPVVDYSAIQTEIDRLKRTYTDDHPDVRKLKRQLERAKAEEEGRLKATHQLVQGKSEDRPPVMKSVNAPNPLYRRLTAQLSQVKRSLESQQARLSGLTKQRAGVEERLARWPQITQLVADKSAEIQALETEYSSLRSKQQETQLSMELVNRAQTEQFRIQDPANFPERPIKPNRSSLYLRCWIAVIGFGLFLALARDMTDQTIRTASDVSLIETIPILVSIPTILTEKERLARKRQARWVTGACVVSCFVAAALLVYAATSQNFLRPVLDYINLYFG